MTMRTPLKEVRRLGSAKEGADHFWTQRTTGAANLLLSIFAIALAVNLIGADHATFKATIANPLIGLPLLLFLVSAAIHMRIGMHNSIAIQMCSILGLVLLSSHLAPWDGLIRPPL